jgi:hypothetical protein
MRLSDRRSLFVSNFAARNPTEAGDAVPRTPWDICGNKKEGGEQET